MEIHRSQKSPGGTQIVFLKKNDFDITGEHCRFYENGFCLKEKGNNVKCMGDDYCNYYEEKSADIINKNFYFAHNKNFNYNKIDNNNYEKINLKEIENLKYIYKIYCEELDETNEYY